MPALRPALTEFIRAQAWYAEVTPAEYAMLETLRDTDKTAQRYGTTATFMDALNLAGQQGWYTDGFDDNPYTYAIRELVPTPHGLFVATIANRSSQFGGGLRVWVGRP